MSSPRRTLAVFALLLSAGASAGGWVSGPPGVRSPVRSALGGWVDGPPGVRSPVRSPSRARATAPEPARLTGPIAALRAIDLSGTPTEILVPPGLDLSDPLPLPEGLFAEIEVELAGPMTLALPVSKSGRNLVALDLQSLTVVLDDPDAAAEAGAVRLDLSHIETDEDLAAALREGLVGVGD